MRKENGGSHVFFWRKLALNLNKNADISIFLKRKPERILLYRYSQNSPLYTGKHTHLKDLKTTWQMATENQPLLYVFNHKIVATALLASVSLPLVQLKYGPNSFTSNYSGVPGFRTRFGHSRKICSRFSHVHHSVVDSVNAIPSVHVVCVACLACCAERVRTNRSRHRPLLSLKYWSSWVGL